MIRWTALALLLVFPPLASTRTLHSERSLYQNVLVIERLGEVCLQFSIRVDVRNQTCMKKERPKEMVFSYTKMMMAALLLMDAPTSILVVGLGGGTLPMALQELFPEAKIDAVEIDPAVVRVAERFFHFKPGPNMAVFTQDARVFGRRAGNQGKRYDLILLDAYNGEYIPEHLMTAEYLQETRALLLPGGIIAANTFAISLLYDHESATYEHVFGKFLNFRLPESANRVVFAANQPFRPVEFQQQRAAVLDPKLRPYAVELSRYAGRLDGRMDWTRGAEVLTDQYSPANQLNR
jgi:spermidine synthase